MRQARRTSPETDRCLDLIYELGSVEILDFHVEAGFQTVTLTGRAASWLARQLATTAAERMYPGYRIDNQLQVVVPR